ncbi:MAG: CarD family transcriptional regulator, partial [Proteobacteria bacterium]|nr:CarD family transcriptional regulator [Pseudomonadota bacterium]
MEAKKLKEKTENNKQHRIREFKVGDLAVYPAHGVGKIKAIESRVVNGEK